jgi:hypothetical protein
MTIGGILVLFIYITRVASNEIFSPSNKIHREVGWAKDLSAPRYLVPTIGAQAGTNYWAPGPENVAILLVFFGIIIIFHGYTLTPSRQAQFTLQLTASLSDLVSRILVGPPSLGGARWQVAESIPDGVIGIFQ